MSSVQAVVTHHRSGFRSGVARFNELLAERLGVPLYGLDEYGPGWARSLLSFKVSELDIADREPHWPSVSAAGTASCSCTSCPGSSSSASWSGARGACTAATSRSTKASGG